MARTGRRAKGDGAVYFHEPSGRYCAQPDLGRDPKTGKRVRPTIYGDTEAEVAKKVREALADHGRGVLAAPDRVTFKEYAERWIEAQPGLSDRTRLIYRWELSHAMPTLGHLKVQQVQPSHITNLMTALAATVLDTPRCQGRPMSPSTQGKVLTRLKAVFGMAVRERVIYASPTDGARKVKAPPPEVAGRVLDFHEAARFREVGETLHAMGLCRLWPALFLCVSVGLRKGETMGLRLEDVKLRKKALEVRRALVACKGGMRFSSTKTHTSRRDVHLPASLAAALEAHFGALEAERAALGSGWEEHGAAFPTALGTFTHPDNLNRALESVLEWSNPDTVRRKERDEAKAAEAPHRHVTLEERLRGVAVEHQAALAAVARAGEALPDICVHDLRHTYATLALRSGVPVEVVSKTLGHSKPSFTMDVYRHVLESERRRHVVDLFDAPVPTRIAPPGPAARPVN